MKPSTPSLASVLLTTHNSASVLEACLESVFRQNYPALEFVIVDNASIDATRDLLIPVTMRDILILGYCLLRKRTLLTGLGDAWAGRKAVWRKRNWIQSHRRLTDRVIARWFSNRPRSFPCSSV